MNQKRRVAFGLTAALGLSVGLAACSSLMNGPMAGGMPPAAAEMIQATLADRAKLRVFDANSDLDISIDELERGLERAFAELDTNRDGALKMAEISSANQRLKIEDAAMPPLRDWNQSGAVEFDEFAAWNRGRFRRTDTNQDGMVTQAELAAPPKMPKRPQGGPPGGMPPGGMPPGGKPPSGGGMPSGRLSQSVANPGGGGS